MTSFMRDPTFVKIEGRNISTRWLKSMGKEVPTAPKIRDFSAMGKKGGRKRAESLTPERRKEISALAIRTRWENVRKLLREVRE